LARVAGGWINLSNIALPAWSRDPEDDKFIHTALESGSRWLISGDHDLLDLSAVEGVQILSPTRALRALCKPSRFSQGKVPEAPGALLLAEPRRSGD
jgi:hypothetical protein